MASPLSTAKQSVDLTAAPVLTSRIRRDPPSPAKKLSPRARDERDHRQGIVGILAIALALFVIILGLSNAAGWSPRQYVIRL